MYRQGSPVDRLPEEILSYVFVLGAQPVKWGMPSDGVVLRDNTNISPCAGFPYNHPVRVASVSKHWRQVALNTPALWNKIFLSLRDVYEDTGDMDLRFASMFLERSRNYRLDIFVDARDPEWDFSEFDPSTAGNTPCEDTDVDDRYFHPFTMTYMQDALGLILSELHRCRFLTVLVDRWYHMYLTLLCLNGGTTQAPLLESLILMRCNEIVAHSPVFKPETFAAAPLLPFRGALAGTAYPRLNRLVLSGVHFDWSAFPSRLPDPVSCGARLHSLDLSYLCKAVRPSITEFRSLLERCSALKELSIVLSMPRHDPTAVDLDVEPVVLHRLEKLTFGYDDGNDAVYTLRVFQAPNLRVLTLCDATSPTAFFEQDGGCVLAYFAQQDPIIPEVGTLHVQEMPLRPLFPLLEEVTVHSVKASVEAFQLFFASLPQLSSLKLSRMRQECFVALRPSRPCDPPYCPCPLVNCFRAFDYFAVLQPLVLAVLQERSDYGAVAHDVQAQPVDEDSDSSDEEGDSGRVELSNFEAALFESQLRAAGMGGLLDAAVAAVNAATATMANALAPAPFIQQAQQPAAPATAGRL
ncbi:uncharacterized protein FIBRA_07517 [Fibroporia radiculosa]|uniref:Uncharacterized protein n=1 Tax=Fibroporia radiculosa TaxID=599839 RepID=J4GEQ6_9APHY|nr:uncharacterized protein FIBRA_07517 [Fibroporia radiculosa]CCM05303.1 predicted protein [Fibroporia radiculosa]